MDPKFIISPKFFSPESNIYRLKTYGHVEGTQDNKIGKGISPDVKEGFTHPFKSLRSGIKTRIWSALFIILIIIIIVIGVVIGIVYTVDYFKHRAKNMGRLSEL
jgi:hypothetical protein